MENKNIKKEINQFIYKFQKEDINEKLAKIWGTKFKKYRREFDRTQHYQEIKYIPKFPLTISLELVNRCNLNCIMCLEGQHKEPRASLSLAIIKKILKQCQEYNLPSLELGLGSEVMLYPDIIKVIKMVRAAGVMDVFFSTNGVLLNEQVSQALIDNKVSRIKISIDAATEKTYKKIRRGAPSLKQTENNIKRLIELKKKAKSSLPLIRLSFLVMPLNKKEIPLFIKKWGNLVDYIDFQKVVDFSHVGEAAARNEINPTGLKNNFCSYPFYSLNIWSNGNVSPCCNFYGKGLIIGNIHHDKLPDLWNNEKINSLRRQIYEKKFNSVCQKCLYYRDQELIDKKFGKIV